MSLWYCTCHGMHGPEAQCLKASRAAIPDEPASHEEIDRNTQIGLHAMAEAHDAKQWQACVDVGEAWLTARGQLPAICCVWFAQSLMGVGRFEDAVAWAEVAAVNMPGDTPEEQIAQCAARSTYAQALARVGRYVKAKSVLKKMVATPVNHPETLEKQGHILLAISDKWRQGWAQHEARASASEMPDGVARWDGSSKGTLGVLHEQGIGDAVLFARWLERAVERTWNPVVWFGPEKVLGRWMADLPGVVVGNRGEGTTTPVDFACFSMSLPHYLGCDRPKDIPAPAAPEQLQRRRSEYTPQPGAIRVGVCWKGSPDGWHDFERSFSAAQFAPVWAPLDGVEFVNLCHEAAVPDDAPFVRRGFPDIYATGEIIAGLDLVVSVDTAVVHVAGSLHVPTLCLAPTVPDWRYQWPPRAGCGSPFYPSVTVVRRERADDMRVIAHARAMVEQFTAAVNMGAV